MKNNPDNLESLLKQWADIEPRPAFDQDVLRRIRLDRQAAVRPGSASAGVWGWLAGWTVPARATAGLVLIVALAGGAGLALLQDRGSESALDRNAFGILRPGSVAGGYVLMSGGSLR